MLISLLCNECDVYNTSSVICQDTSDNGLLEKNLIHRDIFNVRLKLFICSTLMSILSFEIILL